MASIVVLGSMAFDTIETPFGRHTQVLGGSANHFSLSASQFAGVKLISLIGDDFPSDHIALLKTRNIDTEGIKQEPGKTFHWSGRYGYDLHEAQTLETHLNVFERFQPEVPESYKDSEFLFLGNIAPTIQQKILSEMHRPRFVALDTMNFWIEGQRDEVIRALSKCNAIIINEAEIRQLTRTHNIVQAAQAVRQWGPSIVLIKRGEYGALLFDHGDAFSIPAMPLSEVKDPTGAGDTFAGGFMGYLAANAHFPLSRNLLRKATVYGCVMASFSVQEVGFKDLLPLTQDMIEERYHRFVELTNFHGL